MISIDKAIPYDVDVANPDDLHNFLVAVKQYCEELADKAQQRQVSIRSTVPSANDLAEGEFVAYVSGGTIRIYTKQSGSIRYWALT